LMRSRYSQLPATMLWPCPYAPYLFLHWIQISPSRWRSSPLNIKE
jgi:hypothetical protein